LSHAFVSIIYTMNFEKHEFYINVGLKHTLKS